MIRTGSFGLACLLLAGCAAAGAGEKTRPSLPATGVTAVVREGDDGSYRAGAPLRFADHGDGTVTDLNTGLTWIGDGRGDIDTDPPTPFRDEGGWRKYNWTEAINYCERLEFAGQSDWRLPNCKELFSILDLGKTDPAVDAACFPATRSDFYWTSTPFTYNTAHAWYVYFNLGYVNHASMDQELFVRPVRGPERD